jgi:hypothetical protein
MAEAERPRINAELTAGSIQLTPKSSNTIVTRLSSSLSP